MGSGQGRAQDSPCSQRGTVPCVYGCQTVHIHGKNGAGKQSGVKLVGCGKPGTEPGCKDVSETAALLYADFDDVKAMSCYCGTDHCTPESPPSEYRFDSKGSGDGSGSLSPWGMMLMLGVAAVLGTATRSIF